MSTKLLVLIGKVGYLYKCSADMSVEYDKPLVRFIEIFLNCESLCLAQALSNEVESKLLWNTLKHIDIGGAHREHVVYIIFRLRVVDSWHHYGQKLLSW